MAAKEKVQKDDSAIEILHVRNIGFYAANDDKLRSRYGGNYVAIFNRQVVDSSADIGSLIKRLDKYDEYDRKTIFVGYVCKEVSFLRYKIFVAC